MTAAIRWSEEQLAKHQRRHVAAPPAPAMKVGRPKYGNQPTDGHASRKEAKRATELRLLEKAGQITDLEEQVRYELIPAQYVDGKCVERSVVYVADFKYVERGIFVLEDTKGVRTPTYILKRKLMLLVHGIRVRET